MALTVDEYAALCGVAATAEATACIDELTAATIEQAAAALVDVPPAERGAFVLDLVGVAQHTPGDVAATQYLIDAACRLPVVLDGSAASVVATLCGGDVAVAKAAGGVALELRAGQQIVIPPRLLVAAMVADDCALWGRLVVGVETAVGAAVPRWTHDALSGRGAFALGAVCDATSLLAATARRVADASDEASEPAGSVSSRLLAHAADSVAAHPPCAALLGLLLSDAGPEGACARAALGPVDGVAAVDDALFVSASVLDEAAARRLRTAASSPPALAVLARTAVDAALAQAGASMALRSSMYWWAVAAAADDDPRDVPSASDADAAALGALWRHVHTAPPPRPAAAAPSTIAREPNPELGVQPAQTVGPRRLSLKARPLVADNRGAASAPSADAPRRLSLHARAPQPAVPSIAFLCTAPACMTALAAWGVASLLVGANTPDVAAQRRTALDTALEMAGSEVAERMRSLVSDALAASRTGRDS